MNLHIVALHSLIYIRDSIFRFFLKYFIFICVLLLLQETYVWELYQKRNWEFFPVGDCFRKQYEDELS